MMPTSGKCLRNSTQITTITYHGMDAYIRKMFKKFDANNDNHISREECIACMEGSGYYKQEAIKLTDQIMQTADKNKDGKISLDEFVAAMLRHQLKTDEYRMHAVFSALDLNRDGHISVHELKHVLSDSGTGNAGLVPMIEAFKDYDGNKDGKISFEEFKDILEKTPQRRQSLRVLTQHPSKSVDGLVNDDLGYKDMPDAQMDKSNAALQLLDANSQPVPGS